jgi:hypothetical protein
MRPQFERRTRVYIADRAIEQTRQAIDDYIHVAGKKS